MIDFHTHSTFSDGTMTPTEIIKYAKQKGLSAVALTDHDNINGIEEFITAGNEHHVFPVAGIEISADYENIKLHILGLFINHRDAELQKTLDKIKRLREERNVVMVKKLQGLGFDLYYEELQSMTDEIISRLHIAKLMCQKGYCSSEKDVFDKYIGYGMPAYHKVLSITAAECIEKILNAGGIPILAHPLLYKLDMIKVQEVIKNLKNFGLKGIEVIHPTHSNQNIGILKSFAFSENLLLSGGSDFHGTNKPNIDLGTGLNNNVNVPDEFFIKLKSLL